MSFFIDCMCRYCHVSGHWKNQCPKLQEKYKNRKNMAERNKIITLRHLSNNNYPMCAPRNDDQHSSNPQYLKNVEHLN